MRLKYISASKALILLLLATSCQNDDASLTIEAQPDMARLDSNSYVWDTESSLIVYNGENMVLDSTLVIAKDTFAIVPKDSSLVLGKSYSLTNATGSATLYRTDIPLVEINTGGEQIPDEPKIPGDLRLMEKGGELFTSPIGVELRGAGSKKYPKKSFSFELWNDTSGEDTRKEHLLGMREDDDWILDGLWNEPLRIRDYTSHDLWLEMGRYHYKNEEPDITFGIKRKYVELFLNGSYRGIYYLGEKVDRKQLNLRKQNEPGTGGALFKGHNHGKGVNFTALEGWFPGTSETWSGYEIKYPDDIKGPDWQQLYDYVNFVITSEKSVFDSEIEDKIDMENMVDYFIFLNLTLAGDNTGKNLHTVRYDANTPFLHVPWDLDGTFGNRFDGSRWLSTDFILSNGLYDRLVKNAAFVTELKSRWADLKGTVLQPGNLQGMFRSNYEYLKTNGAYERESLNEEKQLPYRYADSEIDFIDSWIVDRCDYLDAYIQSL